MIEQKISLDDTMLELAESLHADGKLNDKAYEEARQAFAEKDVLRNDTDSEDCNS